MIIIVFVTNTAAVKRSMDREISVRFVELLATLTTLKQCATLRNVTGTNLLKFVKNFFLILRKFLKLNLITMTFTATYYFAQPNPTTLTVTTILDQKHETSLTEMTEMLENTKIRMGTYKYFKSKYGCTDYKSYLAKYRYSDSDLFFLVLFKKISEINTTDGWKIFKDFEDGKVIHDKQKKALGNCIAGNVISFYYPNRHYYINMQNYFTKLCIVINWKKKEGS